MKRDQIQITKAQIEPFSSSPKLVDVMLVLGIFREWVNDHIRLDEIINHRVELFLGLSMSISGQVPFLSGDSFSAPRSKATVGRRRWR